MKKVARSAILVVVFCAGCDLPGQPNPKHRFQKPSEVTDFMVLYRKNCAGCHGEDGKLGPAPPLNDPVFLAIAAEEELVKVIAAGRKGTEMPAFAKSQGGTLTSEQVQALAQGMRTRKEWPISPKTDWPPYRLPADKGDAGRGKVAFARACAKCHGDDGHDPKRPINDAAFLGLASEQALRRLVITGRADLGMPNCAEGTGRPLTAAEINDLVALLMSWKQ